jgi:hypothetical protein
LQVLSTAFVRKVHKAARSEYILAFVMSDHPFVCVEQLCSFMVFMTFYIGGGGAFVKIGEENSVLKWTDTSGTSIENLNIFVIMQNSSFVDKNLK